MTQTRAFGIGEAGCGSGVADGSGAPSGCGTGAAGGSGPSSDGRGGGATAGGGLPWCEALARALEPWDTAIVF